MTEYEICSLYRESRNHVTQLQILAELNNTDRNQIIGILVKNGEEIPERVTRQLYKRLDTLDAQISEREKEYQEIVRALNGNSDEIREENMATGFSVMDALNKNSKAGIEEVPKARFRTKDISIFKMYRNEMNFYSIEDVEELAGDILTCGLKQNLELIYEPCEKGEYRIVAGERRWLALKYLVSKGYKEFEIATSKLTTPQDADEEQVEIIIANAYRNKNVADMIEEENRLKASLEKLKAAGKTIKGYDLSTGRLRDVIASMLHMKKTKVAQIEAINNNLIPQFKEELKSDRITFSAAYELSGMTGQEQQKMLEQYKESGDLSHKEVKTIKENRVGKQEEKRKNW